MRHLKYFESISDENKKFEDIFNKLEDYSEEWKLNNKENKEIAIELLHPYTTNVIETNNINDMKNFMNFFKGFHLGQFTFVYMRIQEVEKDEHENINNYDFDSVKNELKIIKEKFVANKLKKNNLLEEIEKFVDYILEEYNDDRDSLMDFYGSMWKLPRSLYSRLEKRVEEIDTYKKYNI